MPRRKKLDKLGRRLGYVHGEPTDMIAVRIPVSLHRQLREEARRAKLPKSRTVVKLLRRALEPDPIVATDGSIFE